MAISTKMTYEEIIDALKVKILLPEENDNFFKNIIGLKEPKKYLSQTLQFLQHPEVYGNKKITFYRKFALLGASGVGKAMCAYAFAKEAELPIIVVEAEKFVARNADSLMHNFQEVLKKHNPAVVLIKEMGYLSRLENEKFISVFSKLCDWMNTYTNIVFFATVSFTAPFPEFVLSETGFNMELTFEGPDLAQREELLARFVRDIPHDPNLDLNKIAKDTLGMSGGDLLSLLNNAYIQCIMDEKEKIDYLSIDTVLSSKLYGQKRKPMTEEERRLTAYHEAGHVIAGYFNDPNYKLSKVEIVHRSQSLGLTIHEDDEDKLSYTKKDLENLIIMCYGGMAAERVMLGTNTSGVVQDLVMATTYASSMVKSFGMSDELGPIFIGPISADDEDDDVTPNSGILDEIAEKIIQAMLKDAYHKAETTMYKYKAELIALSEALIEKETVYREEMLEIFEKVAAERK